jgi:glycosyltransferase involved in cell wall biosynthesis
VRVALLSGANCIHTTRWANGLAAAGLDIHLISLHKLGHRLDDRVTLHTLPFSPPWGYFLAFRALKKLLNTIKPDLVNTHYASGYGTLSRLARCYPNLLSVWGSDVYDFPARSFIHRRLLKQNLKAATAIASTSRCMAVETAKNFDHKHVFITPFGVDDTLFRPADKPEQNKSKLVIGTVKVLQKKYGVDTLIEAFCLAWKQAGKPRDMLLEITGDGPEKASLEKLARELGVHQQVLFNGAVSHERVPEMLNRLDIYVALSRFDSESFGVAIIEASACGLPVIVSDADGPAEVVRDNVTGLVVEKEAPQKAAEALTLLINNEELRATMGQAGVNHVKQNYTWKCSVEDMLSSYEHVVALGSTK